MTNRDGTAEPGGADEIAAARDALDGRHDPLDGRHDAFEGRGDAPDGRRDESSELGELSDLSEMDTMRLQNAIERSGKLREALSNIIKKQGETQSDITDHLK